MKKIIFLTMAIILLISSLCFAVNNQVTVTSTAAVIYSEPANTTACRLFKNTSSSVTIYIANDPGVSTTTGTPLAPGEHLSKCGKTGSWYAVTASSSAVLSYIIIFE